jgi:hypothetical protein
MTGMLCMHGTQEAFTNKEGAERREPSSSRILKNLLSSADEIAGLKEEPGEIVREG